MHGRIDPSFGHDGHVFLGGGEGFAKASYDAVALQPDGAALFAGHTETLLGRNVREATLIERRLPDGRLDPTFHRVLEKATGYGPTVLARGPGGDILYAAEQDERGVVRRLSPDGRADKAFGVGGSAHVPLDPTSIAVDAEGGTIVAGGAPVGGECHDCLPHAVTAVARLDPDGSLDRSFGEEGLLIVNSPQASYGAATGLAIEPDGTIVLRGYKRLFGVTPEGAPDLAFGDGGEVEVGPRSGLLTEGTGGELVTADHSAKACCHQRGEFVLHAYLPDGSPDRNWGIEGATSIRAGDVDIPTAIVAAADGSFTLLGEVAKDTYSGGCRKCRFRPFIARVSAGGNRVRAFRDGLPASRAGRPYALAAIAVAPDGAVLAAGSSEPGDQGEWARAVRLGPRGALAPGFGDRGFAGRRERLPSDTVALGFAAGPGGKLVAAYETNTGTISEKLSFGAWGPGGGRLRGYGGRSSLIYSRGNLTLSADARGRLYRIDGYDDTVRRLNVRGRLEAHYGTGGAAPLPEEFEPHRLAVSPDGKALVVGKLRHEEEMALYELDPDGRPDRRFGKDGLVLVHSPEGKRARALVATYDGRGRILVFGTLERQTLLIRLLADGHPDPSFGDHGRVNFRPLIQVRITSLDVTHDGRIYLVTSGRGGGETTLVRFREDGARDRSFGEGGVVEYEASQPLLAFFPGPRQLLLVAGEGGIPDTTGLTVRAFDPDGGRDRSFGDDGIFRGSPGVLGAFAPIGAVRQPDGKIVIAGTRRPTSFGEKLELIRLG